MKSGESYGPFHPNEYTIWHKRTEVSWKSLPGSLSVYSEVRKLFLLERKREEVEVESLGRQSSKDKQGALSE